GKARVVFQDRMIEFRDQLALRAVPVMKERRDDAARLEQFIEADLVIHLERRGMIRAGTRYLIEKILVRELLENRALDAVLRELQREAETDRPRAVDQHAIIASTHEA